LETVILRDNKFTDLTGEQLVFSTKKNRNLRKIPLDKNIMKFKFIKEIESQCSENRNDQEKQKLPEFKQQISLLQGQKMPKVRNKIMKELE